MEAGEKARKPGSLTPAYIMTLHYSLKEISQHAMHAAVSIMLIIWCQGEHCIRLPLRGVRPVLIQYWSGRNTEQCQQGEDTVQACEYYDRANNSGSLCLALLACEEFSAMEHLCTVLPDKDAMLLQLGTRFQAAGLVQQAINAFCKA